MGRVGGVKVTAPPSAGALGEVVVPLPVLVVPGPVVVPAGLSVIALPVRNPFTSEVEFSADPAKEVKEETSLPPASPLVEGVAVVVVPLVAVVVALVAVVPLVVAVWAWEMPINDALSVAASASSVKRREPGFMLLSFGYVPSERSVWLMISTAVAESTSKPPSLRATVRMRVVFGVSASSSISMLRSEAFALIISPLSIFS